jgi:hypothetical protein
MCISCQNTYQKKKNQFYTQKKGYSQRYNLIKTYRKIYILLLDIDLI